MNIILRKRKYINESIKNIKNIKKQKIINWDNMISPSNIRNHVLNDPLLDWIKYYNIKNLDSKPLHVKSNNRNNHNNSNNNDSYTKFIMDCGIDFENIVLNKLKNKYYVEIIGQSSDARSIDNYNRTLECMNNGTELIYQGVLHDYINNMYGCPDILIRSDRINEIFHENITTGNIMSPNLNQPFHYIPIDIKHSTLDMASDNKFLKNNTNIRPYKSQILMYCRMLGSITGYQPTCGYILGKKMIFTQNNKKVIKYDYMERLATIDYMGHDNMYNNIVDNAITWIKNMRQQGNKWSIYPQPSVPELYPNMKNKDLSHYKIKKILNDEINDITSLWYCGIKQRTIAHANNIYKWTDTNLNASKMGFNITQTSKIIDSILEVNHQDNLMIRVNDLKINKDTKWKNFGSNTLVMYIDYETMNHNIGQLLIDNNVAGDIIFMIGIGWEENSIWKFNNFTLEENTLKCELTMIKEFHNFINNKKNELGFTKIELICWTQAEPSFYNKFLNKHKIVNLPKLQFYDLHRLFYDNMITIKGALNFSLKSIANAMYHNNMIETTWNTESSCTNGMNAMHLSYELYKNNTIDIKNNNIMKEIIYYNEIDCKVMWEILKYLRNNIE